MNIGGYKIRSIDWGDFTLDGGSMFGVVPKSLWEKKIPPDANNQILMKTRGLLLSGNNKNILIDLGIGNKEDISFLKRYNAKIKTQEDVLKSYRLNKDDITDIFITHLHFDHCGGATVIDGKKIKPAFKNATYYIQKKQWDSAIAGEARDNASFFKNNFLPIKNRVLFLDGDGDEIVKNISVITTNGHTISQQHPIIRDENNTLFYCADIFPTSAHISPRWLMAFDNLPETAMKEKELILEKAAKENWIMFFEHDPEISACKIKKENNKFRISEKVNL